MALSLSNFLYAIFACSLLVVRSQAATVTYDWTVGWVTANPDKLHDRPTMGINGQWPLPLVNVTKGDRVIVNVKNDLGNQTTSLHFHGLFQNGTTYMDGPVGVSQCGIPAGSNFTYDFVVDQPGTYWYHSHLMGQYPDGLRGPMVVQDPESPYLGQYDEQIVMTLSDWYHEQMPTLVASFINVANPTGAEPIPDSALMNDSQNVTFAMQPGKTYLFHIVNMGAFAGQNLWFEGHTMQIVEVDGVWTEKAEAEMIYLGAAQRYSVLITAKNDASANYAIISAMDQTLFDYVPASLMPNVTGYLLYNEKASLPEPTILQTNTYTPYDDFNLVPVDRTPLFEDATQTVSMILTMSNLGNGANYAFLNDISYVPPKVPTLYSVLTTGDAAASSQVYGRNTNAFVLGHNEVTDIVLNNHDSGKHPFHLHGHNFQVVVRSPESAGDYDPTNETQSTFPAIPMRRDTLVIQPEGHFVIRFRSDNPGVWLFHCHIEWHVDGGLIATIVEAPMELQQYLNISSLPASHLDACRIDEVPISGNGAGNSEDFYDLRGESPEPAPPLPAGFTAKGIVALVFSCISALLGMVTIGWYGAKPLSQTVELRLEHKVEDVAIGVGMEKTG